MLINININVSYKTNDTTEKFLAYKQEECIDKYHENGTYTLKYLDCGKRYLGQRGRPFEVRFKKNIFSIINIKIKSLNSRNISRSIIILLDLWRT